MKHWVFGYDNALEKEFIMKENWIDFESTWSRRNLRGPRCPKEWLDTAFHPQSCALSDFRKQLARKLEEKPLSHKSLVSLFCQRVRRLQLDDISSVFSTKTLIAYLKLQFQSITCYFEGLHSPKFNFVYYFSDNLYWNDLVS